jgi:hypothetical protein
MKLVLSLILLSVACFSQSIQRQSISPYGSTSSKDNITFRQTVGQPYNTTTNYTNSVLYRPGFQQPVFAINDIKSTLAITVFPNPAYYTINLSAEKTLTNVNIEVIDNAGRTIYENKLAELMKFSVNCSLWAGGTYVIRVTDSKDSFTGRLIIYR